MRHWFLPALAMLAILWAMTGFVSAAPWTIPTLGKHVEQTNVTINGECSGTVIDANAGLILSAHHCKKDRMQIEFRVYDGADILHQLVTTARPVAEDPTNDLLLLRADLPLPFDMEATLHEGEVFIGSDVFVVGSPLGTFDNTVSRGILGSKHEAPAVGDYDPRNVWVIDARSMGGNSGGGVYLADGTLIGVISGGLAKSIGPFGSSMPVGVNFITPLPAITAFLAEYDAAQQPTGEET